MNSLTIQLHEQDDFSCIPARFRKEVERWRSALDELLQGRCTRNELASRMGVSRVTVARKLKAVEATGWRGLVPDYKGPSDLPPIFIDHFRALVESYQRNSRAAFRELVRRWARKEMIPGYEGHPGWPNLPRGWSERNLYRYLPTKLELKAMRIGLGKAKADHGPKTFTTRAGLWPFSHLVFDDMDHPDFVHVLTNRQLCRVSELGCLDALSADRFAWGARPQLKRPDGTTDKLKEANMRFLLAHVLHQYGYSEQGTQLVVEHGTATIRGDIIDLVRDRTRGVVTVRKGGMTGKEQAIAGMFQGRGGGNPRHKAMLESHHNLMQNEMAALPAQTGKDIDHRPESLHGLLGRSEDLLKAYDLLPESTRNLLRLPTLEFHSEFLPTLATIYEQIANRTWHELEGWAACGFLTTDYRLSADADLWLNRQQYLALPPQSQFALAELAKADPRCQRPRKLSPREVFQAGLHTLVKPPVGLIAEILYQDLVVPRQCADGYFSFKDAEVAPDDLYFESRVKCPDGSEVELRDRETYEVLVNPFDPAALWVFNGARGKGAFLGLAKRVARPCRADTEAVKREWGRQEKRLADQLAPVRRRHSALTRKAAEDARHNADVIGGTTPADKVRSKALKKDFRAGAEDLLGEENTTPTPEETDPTSTFDAADLL